MHSRSSFTTRLLTLLLIGTPILWIFGRPAFSDRWLGFRDAANYYQPLFAWEAAEWAAGRIPLWNPADNCGTPVLADATSSVFYPGKLCFLLPLTFEMRFHIYVVTHLLLAALATYWLARNWNRSREAATLAAVAYALGGNVLFQCNNVVFLVGAAWLPLAFGATDRMLRKRSIVAAVALGGVLAMMTLGGDPQAAYHVLLGATLYALLLVCRRGTNQERAGKEPPAELESSPGNSSKLGRFARNRLTLIALAAGTGFVLAAIQILPSSLWTQGSERAAYASPRSLPELVSRAFDQPTANEHDAGPAVPSAIWDLPRSGSHHAASYQFSVGPWRGVEFVWPNVFGSQLPRNRRWISALPGEGRVWTPSMYMGLLPFLLALSVLFQWRLVRRDRRSRQRWLGACFLLAGIASFGWYGLGWIIHELRYTFAGAEADQFLVGPQVGGLYWLLATILPGYVYFRYPAKLMVVAALAVSVLAAFGWDRAWRRPTRLPHVLLALSGISALAMVLLRMLKPWFYGALVEVRPDQVFGPLDVDGAFAELSRALLHTALLCLVFRAFLRHATAAPASQRAAVFRRLALVATVVELVLANGPLITTVPGDVLRGPARAAVALHNVPPAPHIRSTAAPRVYRHTDAHLPSHWRTGVDRNRLTEVVTWERDTLQPKHHLRHEVALIESFNTLSSHDYRIFINESRKLGPHSAQLPTGPSSHILDLLSTEFIVAPQDETVRVIRRSATRHQDDKSPAASGPLPRAWIAHQIKILPKIDSTDPRVIRRRTREVLMEDGRPRDLSQVAVIETDPSLSIGSAWEVMESPGETDREFCEIVTLGPQRIELRCRLETTGWLVMNDLYYPGWRAFVQLEPLQSEVEVPILRTNRILRSVELSPGEYRVAVVYRPLDFYLGAGISVFGWLLMLLGASIYWRRTRAANPVRFLVGGPTD